MIHGDMRTIILDDPSQLQDVLDEVAASFAAVDFTDTFTERVFPEMERTEHKWFDRETAPDETPWAQLKPSTVRRKGHSFILFETGFLEDSLTVGNEASIREAYPREAHFGTSVPYAIYHMTGTRNMPARVHTGLNEKAVERICDFIADATVEQIKGSP